MPETSVSSDLEQSFYIFSQFCFKHVGCHLKVFAFFVISESVKEPSGYSMTFRIVDDVSNSVTLFFVELTCSDSWIDSENFTDKEAKPSSNSFDFLEGKRDSSLAINVGVEDTMDVFEVGICVFNH